MQYREEQIALQIEEIISSAVMAANKKRLLSPEMREVVEEAVRQRLELGHQDGPMMVPFERVVEALEEVFLVLERVGGHS